MVFAPGSFVTCGTNACTPVIDNLIVSEQIPWASFQGGGLRSTTFVAIHQNVCLGL